MLLLVHNLALVHLERLLDLTGYVRVPLNHLSLPTLNCKYVVVVDTIVLLRGLLLQLLLDQLNGVGVLPTPVVVRGVRACLGVVLLLSAWGLDLRCFRSTEELRE